MIKPSRMRRAEREARMGLMRNAYQVLVGKPEEKKQLERTRCRWEDDIGMDLREMAWEGVHCVLVDHDRHGLFCPR